ncbi:MAG: hypothetical protein GDA52_01360 [Rhodobacteraceae bacterium]|nr:hypothetical protein [Paracoccaceae bacterium]
MERILALEGRLATALDRITGAAQVVAPGETAKMPADSFPPDADAMASAQSALAAAQATNADLAGQIRVLEASRTAARDELARVRATLTEEGARASAGEVEILRRRVTRLRGQIAELRDERDAALDRVDEVGGESPEGAVQTCRAALRRMQTANAALTEQLEELRHASAQGDGLDSEILNAAMAAELNALKSARMAEAAEMQEILRDLTPLVTGENANA